MYRSSYGGTATTVTCSIRRQQQRRRRQRICTFPNTIIHTTHIRDSGTSIIHNTKCHYYYSSTDIRIQHNYIGTTKAQISYSQQQPQPQQSPHQRFSVIHSTRFLHQYQSATILVPQKNDCYQVKVYTKFPFLQLHSQRQISSDTSKTTNTKSKMNSGESTTVATAPSTPTSSKATTTTGNNSIAKIDTTTDLTKEDEQEVR
jgi:hypothetical protein